jgi:hypothetical protein
MLNIFSETAISVTRSAAHLIDAADQNVRAAVSSAAEPTVTSVPLSGDIPVKSNRNKRWKQCR